jgi:hypothetical protein
MVRFAVLITGVEIVLTIGAAFAITLVEPSEPYLTDADLRSLRIPYASLTTSRTKRFDQIFYDTRVELTDPPQILTVSLRTDHSNVDYDHRLNREQRRHGDPRHGTIVIVEEPMPGERGYCLRQVGPGSVRSEIVRIRGTELLIATVTRAKPFETTPTQEVVKCERRARNVELYLLEKLRWRE